MDPLMLEAEVLRLTRQSARSLRALREKRAIPYIKLNARTVRYDRRQIEQWIVDRTILPEQ